MEEIFRYKKQKIEIDTKNIFLVIKSQDQIKRRKRMIESQVNGKIGRINKRPVATGLLVKAELNSNGLKVIWQKEFREPRHIKAYKDHYLLTEINRLLEIDKNGNILNSFKNPWFAFLHTIDVDKENHKALISSSGYDMILEIDLNTGIETWRWEAWKNGFNPDDNGNYLASNKNDYDNYLSEKKKVIWIKPENFGEQGIMTAHRTAHPNMAYYHPFKKDKILVAIAHNGIVYEINKNSGEKKELTNFLHTMAHGLKYWNEQWIITDTTKGKFYNLDKNFGVNKIFDFSSLPKNLPELKNNEWIQQVNNLTNNTFIALDANRGLIVFNTLSKVYNLLAVNENWCLQDLLLI